MNTNETENSIMKIQENVVDEDVIKDSDESIEFLVKSLMCRGKSYFNIQEYEKSISDFTKVIELMPDYEHAYYCRGHVYAKLNQNKKAKKDFDESIRLAIAQRGEGNGFTFDSGNLKV